MHGWLINDCLTTIPGTKTFWHDLLEWIPDLEFPINTYVNYNNLAERIEDYVGNKKPDYIIRNATYFRPLNIDTKTISFLQDICGGKLREQQIEVCNKSDVVVFNSPYTYEVYKDAIHVRKEIIPIGVDFDLFKPFPHFKKIYDIIYVGNESNYPKGFNIVRELIDKTNYNFCLVMKNNFRMFQPRVFVHNKVSHDILPSLYNASKLLICTSREETLHLAGIEAAACGLPIIASNVGIYHNRKPGLWGTVCNLNSIDFKMQIDNILFSLSEFNSREYFLNEGLDKKSCKAKWIKLIDSVR